MRPTVVSRSVLSAATLAWASLPAPRSHHGRVDVACVPDRRRPAAMLLRLLTT